MGEGRSVSLSQVVGVAAAAWFAFWACAPTSVVAPMVPLNQEKGWDLGAAAGGGAYLATEVIHAGGPYDTASEIIGETQSLEAGFSGQAWAVQDLGRVDLGGTVGWLGRPNQNSSHLGVMVRPHLIERDDLVVGLDVQAGFLWLSLGVPISKRITDRVWVYTDPSLGLRYTGILQVPVGLSVEIAERVRMSAELDYLPGDLGGLGYFDGPMLLGNVGVSFRP